jgi:Ca2+-binding RTX toxin-like protein
VTGNSIKVDGGNDGNTVNASGLTAPDRIIVRAGTGADILTGGPGNDVFYAGGDTKMTGGTGTNQFIFSAPGSNMIADFGASTTNELVFSNSGFILGLTGATSTPQQMTSAEATTLFTANSTGAFANTSHRLAYDTTNGELFSSSDGSGGASHLVAT